MEVAAMQLCAGGVALFTACAQVMDELLIAGLGWIVNHSTGLPGYGEKLKKFKGLGEAHIFRMLLSLEVH